MRNSIFSILIIINIVGAAIFLYDKEASRWGTWRVRNLVMEFLAYVAALGVFIVTFITKHKTTKFKRTLRNAKFIALIQFIFLAVNAFIK